VCGHGGVTRLALGLGARAPGPDDRGRFVQYRGQEAAATGRPSARAVGKTALRQWERPSAVQRGLKRLRDPLQARWDTPEGESVPRVRNDGLAARGRPATLN